MKTAPLGVCDLCGLFLPDPYTSKGTPRRYCSRECRNTANSRAGSAERSRKAKARVAAGEWQNPMRLRPPTSQEQATRARRGRLAEVAAGNWRNPALSPAARAKLSRPRLHSGRLAEAIERLRVGARMTDLTPDQADAYRAHARDRAARRWAVMPEDQRERRRAQWRAYWRRRQGA